MGLTADIAWWDSQRLAVRCPLCEDEHVYQRKGIWTIRRGFTASCDRPYDPFFFTSPLVRSSLDNGPYFEIDKENFRFVPGDAVRLSVKKLPHWIGEPISLRTPTKGAAKGATAALVVTQSVHQMHVVDHKALAAMRRHGDFPDIYAMSGWDGLEHDNFVISQETWTPKVMEICQDIGFDLEPSPSGLDQGIPGQFNACHVEKQLIAYFIYKHLCLPHELQQPEEPETSEVSETLEEPGSYDEILIPMMKRMTITDIPKEMSAAKKKQRLTELWESRPPESTNWVHIFVSNEPAEVTPTPQQEVDVETPTSAELEQGHLKADVQIFEEKSSVQAPRYDATHETAFPARITLKGLTKEEVATAFVADFIRGIKIPRIYKEATENNAHAKQWRAAMAEELLALHTNGTFVIDFFFLRELQFLSLSFPAECLRYGFDIRSDASSSSKPSADNGEEDGGLISDGSIAALLAPSKSLPFRIVVMIVNRQASARSLGFHGGG
ncbi:hypothetical protein E4U15_004051 [Claviceps sp. LM218 group G6]|nr:hypothetical protein E4U15_004051 [Claviceps sp. LM218 group G6]